MNPDQALHLIAALVKESGHPDLADVTVLNTPCVRVDCADGSTNYLKIAHVQAAGQRTPEQPTWPHHLPGTDRGARR